MTPVKTSPLSAAPGCRDRLDSLAAQLFTALVSLAQAQRRMHSECKGGSGDDGLPAGGCRSQRCGVMPDPGVIVPEDAALGRGGGGTGHLAGAPFRQGSVEAGINACTAAQLSAGAGTRLMPGRSGEGCKGGPSCRRLDEREMRAPSCYFSFLQCCTPMHE